MGKRSYRLRHSPRVTHIQEVPEDRETEPVMKCAALSYRPGGTNLGYGAEVFATVEEALKQVRYKALLFDQRLCKRCEKAAERVIEQQQGKGSA